MNGKVCAKFVYWVRGERIEVTLPVGDGAEWRTADEIRAGVPHHVEAVGQVKGK